MRQDAMFLSDLLSRSRDLFLYCVEQCNAHYRSGHDLSLYRDVISRQRNCDNLGDLIEDEGFINLVWQTLHAWNMNQRAAMLVSEQELS